MTACACGYMYVTCLEHVSAIGRSRVDRSIQYKYLNPNLVAVITDSIDPLRR